jgi:deoxyribodipyrimidine photo-lyase
MPQMTDADICFNANTLNALSEYRSELERRGQALHLIWLRRDLRCTDLATWDQALGALRDRQTKGGQSKIQFVFIFDRQILENLRDPGDRRLAMIHQTLESMQRQLAEQCPGAELWVWYGRPQEIWPQVGTALGDRLASVHWAEDYEPYARERDAYVLASLRRLGVEAQGVRDHLIFAPGEILKADGRPYSIFTPFSKVWKARLQEDVQRLEPCGPREGDFAQFLQGWTQGARFGLMSLESLGFGAAAHVTPKELPPRIIRQSILTHYQASRDFPAIEGTSKLGMHLRFGTLSPRILVAAALGRSETFLNELIWREFFQHILWFWPESATQSWRGLSDPRWNQIAWREDAGDFERWKLGQTGFPLVDAGMRELAQTGWMHNRVRMVVASFLTKQLLLPWQWGERYTAELFLDFDLGANVGNWQWAAGTGCDAAPWFRVFNPELQFKKFDSGAEYVRKFVPEWGSSAYPEPMVDLSFARQRCLSTFKDALGEVMPPTRTLEN